MDTCELGVAAKYYALNKNVCPVQTQEVAEASGDSKKKKVVIAKSSVLFEVMPYKAEVPITESYDEVKKIEIPGLLWGERVTVTNGPYGLKGIQFGCVIEDALVKTDDIEEAIETLGMEGDIRQKYINMRRNGELDDYEDEWEQKMVGSVRVISFNKI